MKKIDEEEEKMSDQESLDLVKERLLRKMEAYHVALDEIETPEETESLNQRAEEEADAQAEARRSNLSPEEQEALRLGEELMERRKTRKVRSKKKRVYILVAAVFMVFMAAGITGVGAKFKWLQVGQKSVGEATMITVESDEDIISDDEYEEKEAYDAIDSAFGIPVLELISDGINFDYVRMDLLYGIRAEVLYDYEGVILVYTIVLNPTDVSHEEIIEDTVLDEYVVMNGDVEIQVKHYVEEESGLENMMASYTVNNVYYSVGGRMNNSEFDEIVKNLYFY